MALECDLYGFFNGIYGLEQSNWSNFFRGIIPDGVLAGFANEMEVYVPTGGKENAVFVRQGQAMVDNHRVWWTTGNSKSLTLTSASSANPRIDLIVLEIVYGDDGESVCQLNVVPGTPAASPKAEACTTNTGTKYQILLAEVYRKKGINIIQPEDITDRRYIFHLPSDSSALSGFSGTSVVCKNDIEHRNNTAISKLYIYLPKNPQPTFNTGVCFTSGSSFTGVEFRKGNTSSSEKFTYKGADKVIVVGDSLTMKSKRYNLIIWYDGYCYWCTAKGL